HLVRVGACADVDAGVEALAVQVGVVPAAAQVVALVLVRRGAHPGWAGGAVGLLDQVDGHTFPVGFVVVDASVDGAPVVHRVEEPVLQDDVTALTGDPAVVVGVPVVEAFAVAGDGSVGDTPGDGPPYEQGELHEDVQDPAQ